MARKQPRAGSCHYVAMVLVAFGLIACPFPRPLLAQNAPRSLWVRDSLRSSILGETRYVRVSLPAFYGEPYLAPERFPVLIVLDAQAELAFTANAATVRTLSELSSAPEMPPLIVVGVETPNPSRFRDLTPPPIRPFATSPGFPAPGGAPAFLRFLSEELRPYITAKYRSQSATFLAGHSLSGAFAAWAFGHAPEFFTGVIALSPTPGWLTDDELAGRRVLDGIAARAKPGRLFLASGTAERFLSAGVQSFAAALQGRTAPGLALEYVQIPEAAHTNTQGPRGMIPGLQFIFRPVSLSGYQAEYEDGEDRLKKFSAEYDSTRQAFLRGARQLGLQERLPLIFLSRAQGFTDTTMAPLQLRMCEEIASSYPTLWNGYDCAGDALARLGRAAEANERFRRGSEAAKSAGDSATAARLNRKAEPHSGAAQSARTDQAPPRIPSDAIRPFPSAASGMRGSLTVRANTPLQLAAAQQRAARCLLSCGAPAAER